MNSVWRKKPIRYIIPALLLLISTLYWVASLWYIMAGLYETTEHLVVLVATFALTFGMFVWIIHHLRPQKT